MKPIEITLEVLKINKDKITSRTYTNNEGVEVTVKEYKAKVIPLKERKFVTKGNGWEMFKTHFVVEAKTNKEDPDNFIGSGFEFVREEPREVSKLEAEDVPRDNEMPNFEEDVINPDDIPF